MNSGQLKSLSTYDGLANSYPASKFSSVDDNSYASNVPSDLRAWIEQTYEYFNWYQGVMSGQIALKPGEENDMPKDPQKIVDLQKEYQWALEKAGLQAPGWDPAGESPPSPDQGPDPFGGMPGTMHNLVHNEENAKIGFIGNDNRDIWSNNVEIDVAPLSANVTAEITNDPRIQPDEQVLKITVQDPATGTTAVYYVHDFQDANIKIKTPSPAQLTFPNGPVSQVHGEKFSPSNTQAQSVNESNVAGVEQADGSLLYDVPSGGTAEFTPQGSGIDGDVTIHDVYGNADITPMSSDHEEVDITKKKSDGTADEIKIHIKHRDGSEDVYIIHSPFKATLNASPEFITYAVKLAGSFQRPIQSLGNLTGSIPGLNVPAASSPPSIPDGLENILVVKDPLGNDETGSSSWSEGSPVNTSDAGLTDTAPSRVVDNASGKTAVYDNPDDDKVEIHTSFEDDVNEHHISTAGKVEIYTESNTDKVFINKEDGKTTVTVYQQGITDPNDPNYKTETYVIEGDPSHINIHALPSNVRQHVANNNNTSSSGWSHKNPSDTYDGGDEYIAGSVPTVTVSNEGPAWPGDDVLGNIPTGGSSTSEANALALKINEAIRSGDWSEVNSTLIGMDGSTANNVVRKIITAIWEAAGENQDKFIALMKNIPEATRRQLEYKLDFEPEEIQDGDAFNTSETKEKIETTMGF